MSGKPSPRMMAKALAVVLALPNGVSVAEVAWQVSTTEDTARRALCELKKLGKVVLASRGPASTWVAPQHAAAVLERIKNKSLQAQRETNRRSRRAHREREKARPFDDNDKAQDYFTQTWREAGTWERQTTGVLAPATWLCPALI